MKYRKINIKTYLLHLLEMPLMNVLFTNTFVLPVIYERIKWKTKNQVHVYGINNPIKLINYELNRCKLTACIYAIRRF